MKPSIDDIRTVNAWASAYDWSLSFIQFPSGVLVPDAKQLDIRCSSSEQPTCDIEDIPIGLKGFTVYQAGKRVYRPIQLRFYETEENMVTNLIRDWKTLAFVTQTGVQQPKSIVEATIRLARLSRLGQEIYEYILIGAWPTSSDPGGHLGDTAEILSPVMNLRYDYFLEQSLV